MSRLLALGVMVLLALAGCAEPEDPAPQSRPSPSPEAPEPLTHEPLVDPEQEPGTGLLEPPRQVYSVDNTQREAFLAVSPDGMTILACAHGNFLRPSHMFASTDGGATFRELTADVPGVGGDCDVALAEDGTWAFLHSTVAGATIATTSDNGTTWTINALSAIPTNGGADRPWMSYVGNTLMISYQPGPLAPGFAGFVRSEDHGASWSVPALITPADGSTHVSVGRVLHDKDADRIIVPVYRGNEATSTTNLGDVEFGLAISEDDGDSWAYQLMHVGRAAMSTPTGVAIGGGILHWVYATNGFTAASHLESFILGPEGLTGPHKLGADVRWARPWTHVLDDGHAMVLWQQENGTRTQWNIDLLAPDGTALPLAHDIFPGYGRDFAEYAQLTTGPGPQPYALIPDLEEGRGTYWLIEPAAPS